MMMPTTMQSQSGSSFPQGRWKSGTIVKVKLDAGASACDAQDIHVMVFPNIT